MKSNFLKSFILIFFGTLAIYGISKLSKDRKSKPNSFRLLSNKTIDDITSQICGKTPSDFNEFYNTTGSSYEYKITDGNKIVPELVDHYLETKEFGQDQFIQYGKTKSGYVFIAGLLALFIVLFIPYTFCVFCRCCMFCPKSCTNCSKILLLASIALCAGVVINCITGYTENSDIVDGVYGFGCSVLKIEQHLIKGDEYKVKPYWTGVNPIIEKLDDTQKFINNLPETVNSLREEVDSLDKSIQDFTSDLDAEYQVRKDSKISNPDPTGEDFTPLYLSKYGPISEESTILGAINLEFTKVGETSVSILKQIFDVIDVSGADTSAISNQLNEIQTYLSESVDKIDSTIVENVGDFVDYLDLADTEVRKYMNILFSVNIILAIGVGISLLFLLCCGKGKCCLGLFWFFIYLLMILSIVIGLVLGILGAFLQDATYGITYVSKSIVNITQIGDETTNQVIDTCINGDGIIGAGQFFDISSENEIIDNIYALEGNITMGIEKIKEYELNSTSKAEEIYDEIKTNIKNYSPELIQALLKIRPFVDISADGSYVSPDTPIYDDWEINKKDCPEGYTVLNPPTIGLRNLIEENKEGKYCLIITEWNKEDIENRYDGIKATDEGVSILEKVVAFYNSIKNFSYTFNLLIENIKGQNNNFKTMFDDFKGKEIKVLEDINEAIRPIRETFEDIVGEDSIFKSLSCGFIKRDLNKVYYELYESFAGDLKVTSTLFLIISGFEGALTILVLTLMARFHNHK